MCKTCQKCFSVFNNFCKVTVYKGFFLMDLHIAAVMYNWLIFNEFSIVYLIGKKWLLGPSLNIFIHMKVIFRWRNDGKKEERQSNNLLQNTITFNLKTKNLTLISEQSCLLKWTSCKTLLSLPIKDVHLPHQTMVRKQLSLFWKIWAMNITLKLLLYFSYFFKMNKDHFAIKSLFRVWNVTVLK